MTLSAFKVWGLLPRVDGFQSRARLGVVLLLSLLLHLAVLWFLGLSGSIEFGVAEKLQKAGLTPSVLAVRFLVADSWTPQATQQSTETAALAAVQVQETPVATDEALMSPEQSTKGVNRQEEYLPSGRLTRLPVPLDDIDLNVTAIDEVALEGVIELTILVEADGTVTHVSTMVDHDSVRQYADRVAARFQNARFSPGEIDGKAVRSKVQITVVSEPLAPPASTT